ncbi:MAG: hypothetical protein ABSC94_02970 [Polyangiaceae bacterium]|jgi:hypothetical protein
MRLKRSTRTVFGLYLVLLGWLMLRSGYMPRNDEAGHKLVAELGDRAVFRKVDVTTEADSRAPVALAVERFAGSTSR